MNIGSCVLMVSWDSTVRFNVLFFGLLLFVEKAFICLLLQEALWMLSLLLLQIMSCYKKKIIQNYIYANIYI